MVDLLKSVKTISRRKLYSTVLKAAPNSLLLSTLFVSITNTFLKFDHPFLVITLIVLLYLLIKISPLLKSLLDETADIESCKILDQHLNLKDRILSWYLIQKTQASKDQRSIIIEHQAEPAVSACDLNRVIDTNLSFYEVVKIILAIATVGFLFLFSRPVPHKHHESTLVSKLEDAINDPKVPQEIKEELLKVKEAIDNHVSTEQVQGLADQALSTIEAFDSNISSTTEGETVPASNSWSSSPTPTPTPTPTATPTKNEQNAQSKNDQQIENQNTVSSKDNKSTKENPNKSDSSEKSQQPQDSKNSPSSSSEKSQSPSDGNPSDSKKGDSKEPKGKDNEGQDSKGGKANDRNKPESGESDQNKNSGKGVEKDKDQNAQKGEGKEDKKNNQETKNTSGQNSKEESKSDKKPGDTPKGQETNQKNNEQDQSKNGKEGKPEKDGEPSKKQESGGAKSDSMMSLKQAKEALNQLRTKNPEKDATTTAEEKNETGKSAGNPKPDENSKKAETSQKQKGAAFGKKDSELALETEEKKGKGDKPDLPSSTKYKDEIITIEQGKIDRNQVGKSTGTKELPKGVAPKTVQEEVAVPLEALTDEAKKQRIPLEYEHLLRE